MAGPFATKSVEQSIAETDEPGHRLKKKLGTLDLTVFGMGVMIGGGIFVLTGKVAAANAGPAVALSFVAAAVVCLLAGLCYAELASIVPVAGSAYTFSYATIGELAAWVIGWDLVLEFAVGAAALAAGFSSSLASVLDGTALAIPAQIANSSDGVVNLPAMLLVLVLTGVLIVGIKLSSAINVAITLLKLAVIAIVIVVGITYVDPANYSPFIPPSEPPAVGKGGFEDLPLIKTLFGMDPAVFGIGGVMAGAAVVFFAFIGFDVVATMAEETRDPQRNLPRGIFASLAIVTILYIAVSLIVTGMMNFRDIDPDDASPVVTAFTSAGAGWISDVIAVGVTVGLTMVCMILFLGQTRVGFAMARDGLLPPVFAKVHPKYGTPYVFTAVAGVGIAALAGFMDFSRLADIVSIGALFAFMFVSIGVIVLRRTRPDLPRGFRVPAVRVVGVLSAILCFYLMLNLTGYTWMRFLIWMAIGLVVYLLWSRHHSRLTEMAAQNGSGPGA